MWLRAFALFLTLALCLLAAPLAAEAQKGGTPAGGEVQKVALFQSIYPGQFKPDKITVKKGIPVEITLTQDQYEHVNLISILPWVTGTEVTFTGPTLIKFTPDQSGTFKIRNVGHGHEARLIVED